MSAKTEELPDPLLWSVAQTAAAMSCSVPTLYAHIKEGNVRAYRVKSRTFIDPDSVKAYLLSDPIQPSPTKRRRRKPATADAAPVAPST